MQRLLVMLAAAALCATGVQGQNSSETPAPLTARQALIEMFFSKTPGTFVMHLPEATRAALENSGALKGLQDYSMLASRFQTDGKTLQTFETGSVLLSTQDLKTNDKTEITVESDSLQGDQDNIEVSFQSYQNGQLKHAVYMPHVTFSMTTESGVWKLNEISMTIRVPLTDPDFLKGITEGVKARVPAVAQPQLQIQSSPQTFAADPSVVAAMRTILTAEVTYAATYRATGYTCTLSDLDGFGSGEPNEHQAMLINSGLASGHRYNYVFTLSECGRAPAKTFHLTAAPNASNFGRRTYCADESGVIKSSADTNPAACWSSGTPIQ